LALCKAKEYISALTGQLVSLYKSSINATKRLTLFIKNADKNAGEAIVNALLETEAAKLIASKMQEYIDNSIRNLTSTALSKLEGYINPYMMILTKLLKYPNLTIAFLAIIIIPLVKALEKEKELLENLLKEINTLIQVLDFFESEGAYSEEITEDILAAIKLLNISKIFIEKSYENIEICNVPLIKRSLNTANNNLCGAIGVLSASNSTFGVNTKAALDIAESPSSALGITGATRQERREKRKKLLFEKSILDPAKQEWNKYKEKGLDVATAAYNIQSIMGKLVTNHIIIDSSLDTTGEILDSFGELGTLECYLFMPVLELDLDKKIDNVINELKELINKPNVFIAKNPFIVSKLTTYKDLIKPVLDIKTNLSMFKKPNPPVNKDVFESELVDISKILNYVTAVSDIENARNSLIKYRLSIYKQLKWDNELISMYKPYTDVTEEKLKEVQKYLALLGISMDVLKFATIGITSAIAIAELVKCVQKQPKSPKEAADTVTVSRIAGPAEQKENARKDNYYSSSAKRNEELKTAQADAEKTLDKVKEFTISQKESGKLSEEELKQINTEQLEKPKPTLANEIYAKAEIRA